MLCNSVRGRVVDRLIFNFRVPPGAVAARLPEGFEPQEVDGSAVVSFCVLRIDRVGVGRVLPAIGPAAVHCAFRVAVVDPTASPAVYLAGRHTASALGSWLTRVAGVATHSWIQARFTSEEDRCDVEVRDAERTLLFSAETSGPAYTGSSLFPSTADFASFMKQGVRSFVPARDARRLACVDIAKEEIDYEPLALRRVASPFLEAWVGGDARFDSVFRTGDDRYEWRYQGLVEA